MHAGPDRRRFLGIAALWPNWVKALISVTGYLITNLAANLKPLPRGRRTPGGISTTSAPIAAWPA